MTFPKLPIVFSLLFLCVFPPACSATNHTTKYKSSENVGLSSPDQGIGKAKQSSKARIEEIIYENIKSDIDNQSAWTSMLKQVNEIDQGVNYCPFQSSSSPRNLRLDRIENDEYLLEVWCSLGASTPPEFLLLKYTKDRQIISTPVELKVKASESLQEVFPPKRERYTYFGHGNYDATSKEFVLTVPSRCKVNTTGNNCTFTIRYNYPN